MLEQILCSVNFIKQIFLIRNEKVLFEVDYDQTTFNYAFEMVGL